jgi:phage N-6-adenine-methyltransferase
MNDPEFTKLLSQHLLNAKGFYDYGVREGLTTPEALRLTIAKRQETARALVGGGMSKRKVAKMLGVNEGTVRNDVRNHSAKSAEKFRTPGELIRQSDQNDWRTPRQYLDAARKVLGRIDLDPASSAEANETVKAAKFYTEKDNGLTEPWKGRLWLNPPYGGEARAFVDRLVKEFEVGNVTAAVLLLNSHPTETKWFQQLLVRDCPVCFVTGRIHFGGPSRTVSSSATHGSVLVYLGKDAEKFRLVFSEFGPVLRRWR